MQVHDKIYIDGAWVPSSGNGTHRRLRLERRLGHRPDPRRARRTTSTAPPRPHAPRSTSGPTKSPEERAQVLHPHRRGPRRPHGRDRHDRHPRGGHAEVAQPDRAGRPADQLVLAGRGAQAENFKYEEQIGNSLVVREPVGVVGCITPWNYPLHQIAAKVAYAMAAGCTVVLKPSEIAPLDAYVLAEVVNDAGLPAGRVQPRDRHRPDGRRGDRRPSRHRHGVVHRLDPRRQARRRGGVADAEARRARARRQVGQHPARRPRRREVREGRPRRHRQGVPQLGPDVHRAHPHARARSRSWPTPSASRPTRSRPSSSPSDPFADGADARPAVVARAGRARERTTSRRASTRAPSSSPAAPASPKVSKRATS